MSKFHTISEWLLFKVCMPLFALIAFVLAVLQSLGYEWWPQ